MDQIADRQMYQNVAVAFAAAIEAAFESEATLKALHEKMFSQLPFDRTERWSMILHSLFREVWDEHGPAVHNVPTAYDRDAVLRNLVNLLDYNLFSQVLLNLQSYASFSYDNTAAEKDRESLAAWYKENSKLDPFAPKAKMIKNAATTEELTFNRDLSTIKALNILQKASGATSFRVSPKGSTPALVDSKNISMIGAGGDRFIRTGPGLKSFFLHWEETPQIVTAGEGGLRAAGIPYAFQSSSGGEILNNVLFARKLAVEAYRNVEITTSIQCVLPRMNSLMIIGGHSPESGAAPDVARTLFDIITRYPNVKVSEGKREF